MKAISSNISKTLSPGTVVNCADNSGAKELQIISVKSYKGHRRAKPKAGLGDLVICRVKRGNEKVRHEIFKAVIIRQKKEFRRPNGMRVSFEDNAAIILDDVNIPKGTLVKGPVAKEVISRFKVIGKIAGQIV